MSISPSKYKGVSFYSGYNYMRVAASGVFYATHGQVYTIPLPPGAGQVYARVYVKFASDGSTYSATGFTITGTVWNIDPFNNTLVIKTGSDSTVSYFIRKSTA